MTAQIDSSAGSTTSGLTADTPMATIALRSDAHASVLDRHHLDFCCGGRRSLSEACARAGLDVGSVLDELNAAATSRLAAALPVDDWIQRPLPELIDHIVDAHHVFTRGALARIAPLMNKVLAKHGPQHPELTRVSVAFTDLASDLGPHMAREEAVLFPYLRALANPGAPPAAAPFGTVRNPVRMMMMQHDRAAELLAEIQEASGDLAVPEGACASYAALYGALKELRLDLLKHVSLENNVLFPRAITLDDALLRRRADAATRSPIGQRGPEPSLR
jgi:regulator of cell morphogenesis and NO signaling